MVHQQSPDLVVSLLLSWRACKAQRSREEAIARVGMERVDHPHTHGACLPVTRSPRLPLRNETPELWAIVSKRILSMPLQADPHAFQV